jgi:cysteine desulfurase
MVGATEHDAVRAAAPGAAVLPVDREGLPDLDALAAWLRAGPGLVCLMLANNETGTILPVARAAALCRAAGARLHVDAVQAAGRMAVDLAALGADSIAVSGHKMGGLPGAGALLLADGVEIGAVQRGGGQERGRRGGTPALPAIAAMAASCGAVAGGLAPLRDAAEAAAVACGAVVLGAGAPRLENTTCLALPGVTAQTQVIALDLAGVAVSAGAACSSGKVGRSPVLAAMGFGADAGCGIRVSLPWNAPADAAERFLAAWSAMRDRLWRRAA